MSALASFSVTDGGVGRIRLQSAENGNALGLTLARQLREVTEACLAEPTVRAVLIEAQGRNFCVGGDISAFNAPRDARQANIGQITTDFHTTLGLLLACDRPIISAIQGSAAGAGMSLALIGDVVMAAESAVLIPAFTAIGLSADGGTTWLLPRLIGARRAAELLLTNRRLTASEALGWGLVSEVCPPPDLEGRARAGADRLAGGPTAAFAAIKTLLRQSPAATFADQTAAEAVAIAAHAVGRDGEDGIAAFNAKRAPAFTGQC
jgi:2-(1,2-epoxy-1,2-dihydrophenyl)acetyl-CoA isomerase